MLTVQWAWRLQLGLGLVNGQNQPPSLGLENGGLVVAIFGGGGVGWGVGWDEFRMGGLGGGRGGVGGGFGSYSLSSSGAGISGG